MCIRDRYEAARSIAEQLPYIDIEDIRIRRELPDTLLIDVCLLYTSRCV